MLKHVTSLLILSALLDLESFVTQPCPGALAAHWLTESQEKALWRQRGRADCQLYPLSIDAKIFSTLYLPGNSSVISPGAITLNVCHGRCRLVPLLSNPNSTLHSIIRSGLDLHGYKQYLPKVRCVPISYSSFTVVSAPPNGTRVTKTLHDLQASSCGCR